MVSKIILRFESVPTLPDYCLRKSVKLHVEQIGQLSKTFQDEKERMNNKDVVNSNLANIHLTALDFDMFHHVIDNSRK